MSAGSSLGHLPRGARWEFDEGVADVFDDMLGRSIPQYDVMRAAVLALGRRYVRDGTDVVDLGSSRGGAVAPLVASFGSRARFHAVEASESMVRVLRERFAAVPEVAVHEVDLRRGYPEVAGASYTQAVLTLQFVPIDHRQRILRRAFASTLPGGALVVVEKVLGEGAEIADAMIDEYHRLKGENGYSGEEIERKRLALEGVLVPVTAAWNVEMIRNAGFSAVDCFWRWMNFAGWLALRAP